MFETLFLLSRRANLTNRLIYYNTFFKKKLGTKYTGLKIQTYVYMRIHTLYKRGICSLGIPVGYNVRSFLMFNPIFVGIVGSIFADTENKVNNIIFGNVKINISLKNT
jgi:hypothetical protein